MSKEATLSDAINHIKKLQNEVLELQTQLADSPGEAREKQGSASCSESFGPADNIHYQVVPASSMYEACMEKKLKENIRRASGLT